MLTSCPGPGIENGLAARSTREHDLVGGRRGRRPRRPLRDDGAVTRIIAGVARGRRLETPRGAATRPTSDRVREALFGSLDARGVLDGAVVLDLFAGSGALGLEAASRGAEEVVLVDSAREAVAVARRNAAALGLAGVRVVQAPVLRWLAGPGVPGGGPRPARPALRRSTRTRWPAVLAGRGRRPRARRPRRGRARRAKPRAGVAEGLGAGGSAPLRRHGALDGRC